ncbi:uncharacterized protein LOC129922416 [Biomphalaria glabrata]|uniref:Uncharacterized protein LOC129922416 n=1 Tax=Biomphalaria glabrata TaxID=6526 RepID=A0A9W2YP02_BIOGL|nr:uncharacterized protein LOC129922416 [Biomphalaria glabrata]
MSVKQSELLDLYETGKKLGYQKEELEEWVARAIRQNEERDARAEERREKFRMQEEETQFKRKMEELQVTAKIKMEEHESKARIAKESKTAEANDEPNIRNTRRTKMQKFVEGTDRMDSFIHRFEMLMRLEGESQKEWARELLSLVGGRALDALQVLNDKDVGDYTLLKKTLLEFYQCSEDDYRSKFHALKPPNDGNMKQFVGEVKATFEKWFQSSGIEESFENLKQFIIVDKIISSAGENLFAFLQERKPRHVDEVLYLCQRYVAAHPGESLQKAPVDQASALFATTESKFTESSTTDSRQSTRCYTCGRFGHVVKQCRDTGRKMYKKKEVVAYVGGLDNNLSPYVSPAIVNGHYIQAALRDTGATKCVVLAKLVNPNQYCRKRCRLQGFGGHIKEYPTAKVHINSPYFNEMVEVIVVDEGPFELLIENVPNIGFPTESQITKWKETYSWWPRQVEDMEQLNRCHENTNVVQETIQQVETRQQKLIREQRNDKKDTDQIDEKPKLSVDFFCNPFQNGLPSIADLRDSQMNDMEIANIIHKLQGGDTKIGQQYAMHNDILVRKWTEKSSLNGSTDEQTLKIVIPNVFRSEILRLGHDIPMSGHLGIDKTRRRIYKHFYWPGINREIAEYCRSCHACQITGKPNQSPPKAPLQENITPKEPFSHILMDCVGPLPRSKRGNQYLLTIMCKTTRYPEAVPLRNIKATTIVTALSKFITTFGLPKVIQIKAAILCQTSSNRHFVRWELNTRFQRHIIPKARVPSNAFTKH